MSKPTQEEVTQRVAGLLVSWTNEPVKGETTFASLEMDEVDMVELILDVEDEFVIELKDSTIECKEVASLVAAVLAAL